EPRRGAAAIAVGGAAVAVGGAAFETGAPGVGAGDRRAIEAGPGAAESVGAGQHAIAAGERNVHRWREAFAGVLTDASALRVARAGGADVRRRRGGAAAGDAIGVD